VSDVPHADRLTWTVRRTEQAFHAAKERALRDVDVHPAHHGVLETLRAAPGSSASALARGTGVTAQTASTLLGRLEERGAVARRVHPRHQHVVEWSLTERGSALLEAADGRLDALERHLRAGLDHDEVERARAVLEAAAVAAAAYARDDAVPDRAAAGA
jgi:DNA-binding MarR family transcriptional regulator